MASRPGWSRVARAD